MQLWTKECYKCIIQWHTLMLTYVIFICPTSLIVHLLTLTQHLHLCNFLLHPMGSQCTPLVSNRCHMNLFGKLSKKKHPQIVLLLPKMYSYLVTSQIYSRSSGTFKFTHFWWQLVTAERFKGCKLTRLNTYCLPEYWILTWNPNFYMFYL